MARQDEDRRPVKRTRSVEVRVSDEEREAFLDRCREQDRSASEVLREAMAHFARSGRIAPSLRSRAMSFTIAASVLALSAALQSTTLDLEADQTLAHPLFDLYDLNADRRLTLPEYLRVFGSVRRLANDGGEGVLDAYYTGAVFGTFIRAGYRGRLNLLFDDQAPISESCWTALDRQMSVVMARGFAEYDADEDGVVTPEEFGAYQIASYQIQFESLDRNGDQTLTVADFELVHAEMEAARREAGAMADATPPERPVMAPGSFHDDTPEAVRICGPEIDAFAAGQPAPPRIERGPARTPLTPQQDFEARVAQADADADGRISFGEFARYRAGVFDGAL